MSWQDRDYNSSGYDSRGGMSWLRWLMGGSVPLGTWFGIRVRVHASLVVFMLLELLVSETSIGMGAKNALTSMSILFFSVLFHEFGHCFGARIMGGEAEDILMWPLGGLAFVRPPHRWWPSFVSTACGPLVNVFICAITGTALAILNQYSARAIPWFPVQAGLTTYIPHDLTSYYLWWIFLVNYALLTFNLLLVFYPFDGGRMVQEILWAFVGYYRSMRFATVFGMIGAVAAGAFALAFWMPMLIFIAVFGFITCYRQRQQLQDMGPPGLQDAIDYSASLQDEPRRRRPRNQRFIRRARRRAAQEAAEQARIDAILEKVSAHGMHSLNWLERRSLHKATERQRRRDLELSRLDKL